MDETYAPGVAVDLSVVVVNWNVRDLLRRCLLSLRPRQASLLIETIVVDCASSDGSVEMVCERFPWVHLIANSENRGFAAANNQGFKIANGNYILMLNPDTIVLNDSIDKMIGFLKHNHTIIDAKSASKDRIRKSTLIRIHLDSRPISIC